MNKFQLRKNLEKASYDLIVLAQQSYSNTFSTNFKYLLRPNVRSINLSNNHLNNLEIENLANWNRYANQKLDKEEIVDLLIKDEKVPVWINICIIESQKEYTLIELLCSRRLRTELDLIHKSEWAPFHLLQHIPSEIDSMNNEGMFDINLKKQSQKVEPFFISIDTPSRLSYLKYLLVLYFVLFVVYILYPLRHPHKSTEDNLISFLGISVLLTIILLSQRIYESFEFDHSNNKLVINYLTLFRRKQKQIPYNSLTFDYSKVPSRTGRKRRLKILENGKKVANIESNDFGISLETLNELSKYLQRT